MSKFRIERIGIDNFKIFSKYFEQSFNGNDLIVFDGPNGFGKTSVFDAVELALTGIIRRLDIYDDAVKNKMKAHSFPFINSESRDFFIKIELVSDSGRLIICRYLKKEQIGQKDKGKIKWERICLGKLNSWDDSYENATDLNQKQLEGLLGIRELDRIFNVFFYVQQEENTFFLKRSENDRKEYLNILFDVEKESKLLEKIKKLLKFQKDYVSEIEVNIKKAEEKKVTADANTKIENLPYEKLFVDDEHEWDKESPDFAKITYKNVVEGIGNIQKLRQSSSEFKKQKEALKIRSYLSSPNFIKNYALREKYEDKLDEIEAHINEGKQIGTVLKTIKQNKHLEVNFWNDQKSFLEGITSLDIQVIVDQIKVYVDQKGNHDKLESTRTEINRYRKSLSEKYKEYIKESQDKKDMECPLCGNEWTDFQGLMNGIDSAEKRFMSNNQASLKSILDNISKYVNQVELELQKKVDTIFYPEDEILTSIRTSERSKTNFAELNAFLKSNKIKILSLDKLKSIKDLKELSKSATEFQTELEQEIESLMVIEDDLYTKFETIFVKYFEQSLEKLEKMESTKMGDKLKYIAVKYLEYSNSKNTEIDKEILKLNNDKTTVVEKVKNIKKIQSVYESKIKEHISKIISDISIPFYINSGRILQEFHGGSGIFVRMGSGKSDGVKFYSDIDLENDPLYSLSSGQISSLVLAFCLTLNDVYREHYMGMLLIDDPIQTMDEINTITFIDLIRNNFSDRQFIISTHEDNFSSLVRYKFAQNDAKVSVVRMKEAI
ncbi:MAG: AAA family ATPase [Halobacteriovoraceae bacterium]|nr:AAA family ATPase [Halobacteriovoraceae bacterium]